MNKPILDSSSYLSLIGGVNDRGVIAYWISFRCKMQIAN